MLNFLPTFATNWLMSPRKTSVFNKWPGVAQCSPITAAVVRSYGQCVKAAARARVNILWKPNGGKMFSRDTMGIPSLFLVPQ